MVQPRCWVTSLKYRLLVWDACLTQSPHAIERELGQDTEMVPYRQFVRSFAPISGLQVDHLREVNVPPNHWHIINRLI